MTGSIGPSSPVRIRLSSTVVKVKHVGDPATATEVEITYSQQGKLATVRAEPLHSGLLAHDDSLYQFGAAGGAGGGAAIGGEGADRLYQRCVAPVGSRL